LTPGERITDTDLRGGWVGSSFSLDAEARGNILKPFLLTEGFEGIVRQSIMDRRYAYTNGFVVSAEGLDVFRLGVIATGGKMNSSGNLSFVKETLVRRMLGSRIPKEWDRFG
jgi:hypothetical protein